MHFRLNLYHFYLSKHRIRLTNHLPKLRVFLIHFIVLSFTTFGECCTVYHLCTYSRKKTTTSSTDLRFLDRGVMSITHRADFDSCLSFHIPLHPVLGHHPLVPLLVQVDWLGRVAKIRAVHHVLQNLSTQSYVGVSDGQYIKHAPLGVRVQGRSGRDDISLILPLNYSARKHCL